MQGEPVQGLRSLDDGFIPPIIDLSLLDRKIFVTNGDAIIWTRKLLDEEGIFAGVSSGAIARVAVRIAGELDEGNVVFIVADDGWKYLSSGHLHAAAGRDPEPRLHRLVVTPDRGGQAIRPSPNRLAQDPLGRPAFAMKISRALYEEMVAHAMAERPARVLRDRRLPRWGGAARVPGAQRCGQPAALRDGRSRSDRHSGGDRFTALGLRGDLHSHTRTVPYPSQTDINMAYRPGVGALWPGSIYIIVGLAGIEPEVRAWRIESDTPAEVVLSVL